MRKAESALTRAAVASNRVEEGARLGDQHVTGSTSTKQSLITTSYRNQATRTKKYIIRIYTTTVQERHDRRSIGYQRAITFINASLMPRNASIIKHSSEQP